MRFRDFCGAVALSCLGLSAQAHGIAGDRIFPATLVIDDPAVGDEFSGPTFGYQPDGPGTDYDYDFEWDKTIVKGFGFAIEDDYTAIRQPRALGGGTYGWGNPSITLKYEVFENDPHEILASIGVEKELGGVGATMHGLADTAGSTTPNVYVGKGLGDLPSSLALFRPFAITSELGYQRADESKQVFSDGSIGRNPDFLNLGLSIQYSLPYLTNEVRDYGWPQFFNRLIPLVEISYSTPATQSFGATTTGTIAPGVLYEGNGYQIGIEALIPATRASGNQAGFIAQFHVYLDDILPDSLGKPFF